MIKKSIFIGLCFVSIAIVAGIFTAMYQIEMTTPENLEKLHTQIGSDSNSMLIAITAIQAALYAFFCGSLGALISKKLGLWRSLSFERKALLTTLVLTITAGVIFSLDYWTFGAVYEDIRTNLKSSLSVNSFIASILYGGIIEEVIMRLFVMSLSALIIWKIFFRKNDTAPKGALIFANIISAVLFAAGHLPATVQFFGELTPIIVVRCFLLNGGFGLIFGYLYRKYGLQYSIIAHMGCHIISKIIWIIFI